MRKILASVLVVLLCSSIGLAQSTTGSAAPPSTSAAPPSTDPTPLPAATPKPAMQGFGLEDGTPVKLRTARTISSADAHAGDTLDFEVLEDVFVGGNLVIPKNGIAWGTVTEAEAKKRMARGGKLNINIDAVRLSDGEKVPLRAVKEAKGGGHTGAMTGGIVATAIVFFPAAPFFLFMHGKDITIPKGTEITAYINGDTHLDEAKFQEKKLSPVTTAQALTDTAMTLVDIASSPSGADIEVDGKFVGSTPSSIKLSPGDHEIAVKKSGFTVWDRKMSVPAGHINLSAELSPEAK